MMYREKMHMSAWLRALQLFVAVITFVVSAPLFVIGEASAASPDFLGSNGDWSTYTVAIKGAKACYALTQPKDQNPKNVRRGPVHFFVTFHPKGGIKNQVSVDIGYPFDNNKKAFIKVGSEKFTLFTKEERAWIDDVSKQERLIKVMKAGDKMTVSGVSKRGTHTKDVYSLKGITAAIKHAIKACK